MQKNDKKKKVNVTYSLKPVSLQIHQINQAIQKMKINTKARFISC